MIDLERANPGLFVREGEREIKLDGLIGDGNSKSSVNRSREAAAAETAAAKVVEAVVVATTKAVEVVVVATTEALAVAAIVELTAMRD